MSTARLRPLTACCLTALLLACVDDPDLPEISWIGEHAVFGAERPEMVCRGTLERIDQQAETLFDLLNSDTEVVEFYLLDDLSPFCANPHVSQGCAGHGVVYSKHAPHPHEIVHARLGDRLPIVLEEGLATHLGDHYPVRELAPRTRLVELLASPTTPPQTSGEYGRAAHFIAYLSETFGWQAILTLDEGLGLDSTATEINAMFEVATGYGTDALLDLYNEYPDCQGFVMDSFACEEDPAFQFTFLDTSYSTTVDCNTQDGLGPYFGFVYTEDTIELGATIAGERIIGGRGDGFESGGFAVLRRCGPCTDNGVQVVRGEHETIPEESLPPGRYTVRFYLPLDLAPATFDLRING